MSRHLRTDVTSRAEIRRIKKEGTPKERVLLFEEDFYLLSKGDKRLLSEKDKEELADIPDQNERDVFFNLVLLLQIMAKRRASFLMYYDRLCNLSTAINTHLKEVDIYRAELTTFEKIICSLKTEYGEEEVYKALNREGILPPMGQTIVEALLSHESIDSKAVRVFWSRDHKSFSMDYSYLYRYLIEARKMFEFNLKQAKIVTLMQEKYAKKYNVEWLIPRANLNLIEQYKKDWAINKRFSSMHYKELLQSHKLKDMAERELIDFLGDKELLFPSYDDIEIKPEELANNLFENG